MASRPNIVVVMTDDHAQWALGCSGNREIRTPTLDYLARTGVRFDNAFCATPVCSPARASFWTGKIPSQHGVHDYLADPVVKSGEHPGIAGHRTLAVSLHAAGYATGFSGKWHLGDASRPAPGFDYWFAQSAPLEPEGMYSPWPSAAPPKYFERHAITDHAIEFLRRRPPEQPFFLFIGHFATHSPWSGHPERLVEQYRSCSFDDIPADVTHPFGRPTSESLYRTREHPREALAQYYAAVSEIDEQLGRVLDELDDQGLREHTLVVYTSDHGLNASHHGLWGKGNATHPYNMLEESIRIPMIVNAPGQILGGQVRSEFVGHCDLHLTLAEFAALPAPTDVDLPGRSFVDLLVGKPIPDWPDIAFGEYGDLRMARSRNHKLILRAGHGADELFDLMVDPRETTNRINDPMLDRIRDHLASAIAEYFERYEDPAHSGLRVRELPRHNGDEAWRFDGPYALYDEPWFLKGVADEDRA
ncbi:MAG TPA: sulfatase-like hydrolase/transferase [Acidimicrobiales bacterium]|nr:sulfatase-like hydrolase/transferase [Acidimicrobiales bacterium]